MQPIRPAAQSAAPQASLSDSNLREQLSRTAAEKLVLQEQLRKTPAADTVLQENSALRRTVQELQEQVKIRETEVSPHLCTCSTVLPCTTVVLRRMPLCQ